MTAHAFERYSQRVDKRAAWDSVDRLAREAFRADRYIPPALYANVCRRGSPDAAGSDGRYLLAGTGDAIFICRLRGGVLTVVTTVSLRGAKRLAICRALRLRV